MLWAQTMYSISRCFKMCSHLSSIGCNHNIFLRLQLDYSDRFHQETSCMLEDHNCKGLGASMERLHVWLHQHLSEYVIWYSGIQLNNPIHFWVGNWQRKVHRALQMPRCIPSKSCNLAQLCVQMPKWSLMWYFHPHLLFVCIQEILSQSAWPSLTYKPNTSKENAQNGAGGQGAGGGGSTPQKRQQKPDPAAGKGYCSISRYSVLEEMEKEGYGWEFWSTVLGLYYTLEVYYTLEDDGPKKWYCPSLNTL